MDAFLHIAFLLCFFVKTAAIMGTCLGQKEANEDVIYSNSRMLQWWCAYKYRYNLGSLHSVSYCSPHDLLLINRTLTESLIETRLSR